MSQVTFVPFLWRTEQKGAATKIGLSRTSSLAGENPGCTALTEAGRTPFMIALDMHDKVNNLPSCKEQLMKNPC